MGPTCHREKEKKMERDAGGDGLTVGLRGSRVCGREEWARPSLGVAGFLLLFFVPFLFVFANNYSCLKQNKRIKQL